MAPFRLFNDKEPGEKQRVLWTMKENQLYLDVISKMGVVQDLCIRGYQVCERIHEAVAFQLGQLGCYKTVSQIRCRWLNFRRLYVKERKRRNGSGNSSTPYLSREMFDAMTRVLGNNVDLITVSRSCRMTPGFSSAVTAATFSNDVSLMPTDDEDDCIILTPSPENPPTVISPPDTYPLEVCLTVLDKDVSNIFPNVPDLEASLSDTSHSKDKEHAAPDVIPVFSEDEDDCIILTPSPEEPLTALAMPNTDAYPLEVCLTILDEDVSNTFSDVTVYEASLEDRSQPKEKKHPAPG